MTNFISAVISLSGAAEVKGSAAGVQLRGERVRINRKTSLGLVSQPADIPMKDTGLLNTFLNSGTSQSRQWVTDGQTRSLHTVIHCKFRKCATANACAHCYLVS